MRNLLRDLMALAFALTTGALAPPRAAAEPLRPPQPDSGRLERQLDRLLVVGSVLYVAAHPDDENTRLLAWLQNGRLLRAGYLSVTRGDGGQNLVGGELGAPLGLIRTQELLAARALDGAAQLFTRARDFGFSKRADEALAVWGHDAVLADVVLAIRRFRPDVIVTRFSPESADTHGHHTASARLAVEAFDRAADPAYLPDDAHRALGPWRARRIVWNRSVWPGSNEADLAGLPAIDVGGYDPWLGLSYGELAAESRSMHRSQGFGAPRRRGPAKEYFQLLAGEAMTSSPLDGIPFDWSRVADGGRLQPGPVEQLVAELRRARDAFRPGAPEAAIPALLAARTLLLSHPEHPWKQPKLAELEQAILGCAGLWAEVVAERPSVSPGGKLPVVATALLRRPSEATLRSVKLPGAARLAGGALQAGTPLELRQELSIPAATPLSHPAWLELPPTAGLYPVRDPFDAGLAESAPPLEAELIVAFGQQELTVRRPLVFKWVDPVLGERYRAVEVLPAVTVDPAWPLLLFPDGAPRQLAVTLRSLPGASGTLALLPPAGFQVSPAEARFELHAGEEAQLAFTVTPPASAAGAPRGGTLRAVATAGGRAYDRGLRRIDHAHLPIQTWLPPAEVRLVRADVAHVRRRLGYVPGPGDDVPDALRQAGYSVTLLSPAALREQPLSQYEAILVGVRAYNTEPALQGLHERLMAYVEAGGTLLVQYTTNNGFGAAPPRLGPFPFTIGRGRVTEEDAPVEVTPGPLFTSPNRLGPGDWSGWVQERGLYFAETWDDRYSAPLAMHDQGEKPLRGSLLVARYGKGAFLYTGLAFFRQLPAGVPGAFRLIANLLDLGVAPQPAGAPKAADRGR